MKQFSMSSQDKQIGSAVLCDQSCPQFSTNSDDCSIHIRWTDWMWCMNITMIQMNTPNSELWLDITRTDKRNRPTGHKLGNCQWVSNLKWVSGDCTAIINIVYKLAIICIYRQREQVQKLNIVQKLESITMCCHKPRPGSTLIFAWRYKDHYKTEYRNVQYATESK